MSGSVTVPAVTLDPASAGPALAGLLDGPVRPLHPVQHGRHGAYLQTTDGRPVAVLVHDAARLPFALVLPAPVAADEVPRPAPGHAASVGGGEVRLGPTTYRPGRWRPTPDLRTAGAVPAGRLPALLARTAGCGVPADRVARLTTALRGEWDLAAAVHALVGLGPGSTPAGDDLLAGAMVALQGRPEDAALAAALGAAVTARLARTTWLSAALLRCTAAGHPAEEVAVLPRLLGATPGAWAHGVERLLRLGHTSGAATAHGFALARTARG